MTTIADISTTTDRMREVLAFALNTLDAEGLEPWQVSVDSHGERVSIYLQEHDSQEAGRRLFAALGGHRCEERPQEKNWTIVSVGTAPWNPDKEYATANIPLGDHMIEVAITCTITPQG